MNKGIKRASILIGMGILLVAYWRLPVNQWMTQWVEWVRSQGAVGAVLYGAGYIAATLFLLPGSILTLGAGFTYGVIGGFFLVWPVSLAAAVLAFLIARYLARARVTGWAESNPRFKELRTAFERDAFKIMLLLRLSPLFPFNFLNYVLGITQVTLRDYFFASLLGMLPGTLLYVYLGSLITNLAQLSGHQLPGGTLRTALFWLGLFATLGATLLIGRLAKRALANSLRGER